jgi:uncharacterized protein
MPSNPDWSPLLAQAKEVLDRLQAWLPHPLLPADWESAVAFRYRCAGWQKRLEPLPRWSKMDLNSLVSVDPQKTRLLQNTLQFVQRLPANNVLLTGARGTGKSSLVRACLSKFADQGLRLIEVDKTDLADLPDLVDLVAGRPERFIIYCDDLSFDSNEPGYKALKSILDGSLSVTTADSNVLIYATSNRRHLLPETFLENAQTRLGDDGEVHPGEALEEKISLSERFGLWLSFYPFSQNDYLAIVRQWLNSFSVPSHEHEAACRSALVWALERGSRSGRVAFQFAKDYAGRRASGVIQEP